MCIYLCAQQTDEGQRLPLFADVQFLHCLVGDNVIESILSYCLGGKKRFLGG